jgi:GNAT-family acetyltransferase (TIGR03103 family)
MAATNLTELRDEQASLKNWGDLPTDQARKMAHSVVLDCGWGRLIFGQTFDEPEKVARLLEAEAEGERDVAFYVRDPHVVIAAAPQTTFLDPSHSFRLDLAEAAPRAAEAPGLVIRPATGADEDAINRLYLARSMVPIRRGYCATLPERPAVTLLVAEEADAPGSPVVGVVMGVDHKVAFSDPDNGASLWALSVDPQVERPGVGKALTEALAVHFRRAGRSFMDLSVMHDNKEAIALYRKLGFKRIPVYCVKHKNPINEKLFVGPKPEAKLNIYAQIIVDEALRRGIDVAVESAEAGLFRLTLGGRSIACRESLSDLTSAVAMSRCDDKALTRRILARAGLRVPDQMTVDDLDEAHDFLARHGRVVVKPARGEQGKAVAVDLRTPEEVDDAVEAARQLGNEVVMEEFVDGQDLRIIVIDNEVVAAAVRRPACVRGDGKHTVAELIDKQSRRRAAATGGESRIPLDAETERCVRASGHAMTDVLPEGETLAVRKTANLHSGGTIHDVTEALHPALAEAAVKGAQALEIPVVGFDFMVADPEKPDYVVIEANERPGLANHEPQPTAERFIDLLFPQTKARRTAQREA